MKTFQDEFDDKIEISYDDGLEGNDDAILIRFAEEDGMSSVSMRLDKDTALAIAGYLIKLARKL